MQITTVVAVPGAMVIVKLRVMQRALKLAKAEMVAAAVGKKYNCDYYRIITVTNTKAI